MGPDDLTTIVVAGAGAGSAVAAAMTAVLLRVRAHARAQGSSARDEAERLRRRHAAALAVGTDGVLVHSASGTVLEVNQVVADLCGTTVAALVGTSVASLPLRWQTEEGEQVAPGTVLSRRRPTADDDAGALSVRVVPADGGSPRWVQVRTGLVQTPDGGHELMTVITDVTGPREVRAALSRSEVQFQVAMENAPIGMVLLDPRWRLTQVNAAFAELLGSRPEALVGRDLSELSHPDDRAAERTSVHRLLSRQSERVSLEKRYLRVDGQTVWVVLDAVLVRDASGQPDQFVAQVRDVTESRMQSELLAHRAQHDALTGLANRSMMQDVLRSAVERPGAVDRVAVLAIDLDEFKPINDRYGHAAGDEVLVHVAGVLRAATAGRGTVARLGGDEFVVVVQAPDAARVAFEVAAAIHAGLRQPLHAQRHSLPVRASVGIAVADPTTLASGAMGLLAAADTALYRAKATGRSRTEVYDPSMAMAGESKHGAAVELGQAIAAGQLVLHYQPTVDLMTRGVVGHEALVRWQHPERGLLLPGAFLTTAKETGLGSALGSSVINQAVAYLARTSAPLWVSVNVGAGELGDGAFSTRVLSALGREGVAPSRFVVELTEASLVDAGPRVRTELVQLRQAGVPVLLDDFGTGGAPLSYLRDMPVSGVKLDMSFTAGIPEDPAAARLSRALGALARELSMVTVAEGIETVAQAEFLRDCGWRYGQGWLFGAGQSEPVLVAVGEGQAGA